MNARAEFQLDPNVVYLNHGAFGAVPRAVAAEKARIGERIETNPMRFFRVERAAAIKEAHDAAAAALGVPADSCALARNVSEIVSALLGSVDLGADDEIVSCSHGYGSVRMAVATWCRRTGARPVTVDFPVGASDDEIVAAYRGALSARTRVVIVDQITSSTASVLPVAAIAAAVHRSADAVVLVDAAHVPGTLPTDIETLGADVWVGNLHKWMFTPRGCAVLWAAPNWRDRLRPLVLSWQQDAGFPDNFEMPGSVDDSGWLAIPAGLSFWAQLGGWEQTVRTSMLVAAGQQIVATVLGTVGATVPSVPAPTMRLVRLPEELVSSAEDGERLRGRLSEQHGVEVPVFWFDGVGYLRIAGQVYNSLEDYATLAGALTSFRR